ncbi:ribonuclease HII [Aquimarina sp. 2201CG5-10]|uniref:ribonuclease HII n=1 Tax=Aquimarina callyspongiae TaxID=3098150 RepID=UPI002AB38296|nr:ribonuclease HII [Aquimarina sp. 2201CG5-10]MDY8136411.1 ribonuclease HII [Aquimarina sp. 2201CG5-10]
MKKIVVVLLSIIFLACNTSIKTSNSLIDYIPQDAQIIIKINDLEQTRNILRDNNFIKNNNSIALFNYFKELPILKEINKPNGLLCFSPVGKNNFGYTYVSKFDPQLIKADSLSQKKIETINYSEKTIHKVSFKENTFFATRNDSILITSSSQLLIENIIREQKNNIPASKDLKKAYEVSGLENAFSILFNGKKLGSIHDSFFPEVQLTGLSNFSGWASVDTTIDQNAIYIDGIAIEKDSLTSTIGIFDNTLAQENRIARITPITAQGFISYTYDDFNVLKRNLAPAQERELRDIPNELDDILSGVSEIGTIFLEQENVFILTALDPETTEESLQGSPAGTYRDIPIYSYDNPITFSGVLNPLIKGFDAKFYISYGEFIIFGSTKKSLETIISNILNKTLLYEQEYYKKTTEKLSDEASILLVGSTQSLKKYISKNTEEEYQKQWSDLNHKGYQTAVLQIVKENDFAHIHGAFQKNIAKGAATSVTQTASTTLENKILNQPILVKNHRSKGMDVAVQDIENNLYLISDKGTIFWKKQLDGAILGDIQQIDIYKNGRYQLLFNTANTLYLLDRDGNTVNPYPKKFDEPLTQPVALFDYDKNKRYRILTTQGNKVKMYNAEGGIVTGFGFSETETDLLLSPKHIRIGTKDHILLSEENGKLNILDRLGRTRVNVKSKVDFSKNEWYSYEDKFTSTTKDGNLVQILSDGNVTTKNLGLNENNHIVSTNKTLVTLSENKLTIKGKTLELDFGVYTEPKLFYINNKIYISVTDVQSKKVYLYDSNAELFPNFPVYGNSVMSLGNMDKDPNLEFAVQGEENGILIYQIN